MASAGVRPTANSMQDNAARTALIERFKRNSKTDHKAAYEAAKEFFQKYPDDTSEDAQYMKRWMVAYERVELNGQSSSPTISQPMRNTPPSPPGLETREMAEARIAITKYHDYASAIKSLEMSSESSKNTPIWLLLMISAQEGIGDEAEQLKYLERYDRLVPDQQGIADQIADLGYKVRKQTEVAGGTTFASVTAWIRSQVESFGSNSFVYTEGTPTNTARFELNFDNCVLTQKVTITSPETNAIRSKGIEVRRGFYRADIRRTYTIPLANIDPGAISVHLYADLNHIHGWFVDLPTKNGSKTISETEIYRRFSGNKELSPDTTQTSLDTIGVLINNEEVAKRAVVAFRTAISLCKK
jgi:hypothetical protein